MYQDNIISLPISDCISCENCINTCPRNAIIRSNDILTGSIIPQINRKLCIKCNKCIKKCPVLNNYKINTDFQRAFASQNKNIEIRKKSSSGGIFSLLAEKIIEKHGYVCGAVIDENNVVRHKIINDIDEIEKIRGSKYVESQINNIFSQIKTILDNNGLVYFSGTPCQIAALRIYLNKDYKKLILQDIICHGVGCAGLWQKYLKKFKKKIKSISFRDKSISWKNFSLKIFFEDNSIYVKSMTKDLYLIAFLKNAILKNSCYNCKFKGKQRFSDITLADYWGIWNTHPDFFDKHGTSLVITNTIKGYEIFKSIKSKTRTKITDINNAIKFNSSALYSVQSPSYRLEMLNELQSNPFEQVIRKYCKNNIFENLKYLIYSIKKYIIKKFKKVKS